jgi:hypothetical protein
MNAVHLLSEKSGPTIGLLAFKYYAREREKFPFVPFPAR